MPNKTIYVSDKDVPLFDRAKEIAGEALSSVLVRALREYVSRHEEKEKGIKEISIKVGYHNSEREQRFQGLKLGNWEGFSDDKDWWMNAAIYTTQKGNYAVHLVYVCKATLLTNKKEWIKKGDYLLNTRSSELLVGDTIDSFEKKVPESLLQTLRDVSKRYDSPVEYLDI